MKYLCIFFSLFLSVRFCTAQISQNDKHRLIVTTDLGGSDPDDIQSMIHLLINSNSIDIEGLISTSTWVDVPDNTSKILEVIDWYEEVLPCLSVHAVGYPEAEYLRSITKLGQAKSNMSGVGEGKDSPGSELIISAVDKEEDSRLVWITAWGGMNTLAQALWKVKSTRSEKELNTFIKKIGIYDVLGQDDAGAWVAKNFPDILYIRNAKIYGWAPSDDWTKSNVQNISPLGDHYPDRIWATEGDSPSFMYVYANGLNVPEQVDFGGWGGRFSKEKVAGIRGMSFIVRSGKDETQYDPYYMYGSSEEGVEAINKWKQHIWNNFAARMLWSATDDFSTVNHHPIAILDGDTSLKCIYKNAKPGGSLVFDASKSKDPDGDQLDYKWSVYNEPSTYKGRVTIEDSSRSKCKVLIPSDALGKTIHLILEITDNGVPALTVYRRIVISVTN